MKVQVDFYSETSEDIYGTMQAKIKYLQVSWNVYNELKYSAQPNGLLFQLMIF